MSEVGKFTIHLEQEEDYAFRVKFDIKKAEDVLMDEPPPLGERNGPNASRMLAAAAANCLSASLMFCLAKEEVPDRNVQTEVTCTMVRNEKRRLRVGRMDVRITAGDELLQTKKLERCMDLFEDFCVVTASIR
ncbi:OsmC family protein, partial [endosymbiont of Ridgeia piscesae]